MSEPKPSVWATQRWWMLPIAIVIGTIALLFLLASNNAIAPFIYRKF